MQENQMSVIKKVIVRFQEIPDFFHCINVATR